MNRRIFENSTFLKELYYDRPRRRKELIAESSDDQIQTISHIAYKIYHATLMISIVHRRKLREFRKTIQFLASGRISVSRKRRVLLVYHKLIPLLIKPLLHLLDEQ